MSSDNGNYTWVGFDNDNSQVELTPDTPVHADIGFFPKLIPVCNRSVASLAGSSALEVSFMAEVHEAGQLINAHPWYGSI